MEFMDIAIEEAERAYLEDEVPVGCVIVKDKKVISRNHNRMVQTGNLLAHAEILCIREAIEKGVSLSEAEIYVTVEPCMMCTGAIVKAGIRRVVFGVREPKTGFVLSNFNLRKFTKKIEIIDGIREERCRELIQRFFKERRDGRVDEGARLEIAFPGDRNGGSNPSPSAGKDRGG